MVQQASMQSSHDLTLSDCELCALKGRVAAVVHYGVDTQHNSAELSIIHCNLDFQVTLDVTLMLLVMLRGTWSVTSCKT